MPQPTVAHCYSTSGRALGQVVIVRPTRNTYLLREFLRGIAGRAPSTTLDTTLRSMLDLPIGKRERIHVYWSNEAIGFYNIDWVLNTIVSALPLGIPETDKLALQRARQIYTNYFNMSQRKTVERIPEYSCLGFDIRQSSTDKHVHKDIARPYMILPYGCCNENPLVVKTLLASEPSNGIGLISTASVGILKDINEESTYQEIVEYLSRRLGVEGWAKHVATHSKLLKLFLNKILTAELIYENHGQIQLLPTYASIYMNRVRIAKAKRAEERVEEEDIDMITRIARTTEDNRGRRRLMEVVTSHEFNTQVVDTLIQALLMTIAYNVRKNKCATPHIKQFVRQTAEYAYLNLDKLEPALEVILSSYKKPLKRRFTAEEFIGMFDSDQCPLIAAQHANKKYLDKTTKFSNRESLKETTLKLSLALAVRLDLPIIPCVSYRKVATVATEVSSKNDERLRLSIKYSTQNELLNDPEYIFLEVLQRGEKLLKTYMPKKEPAQEPQVVKEIQVIPFEVALKESIQAAGKDRPNVDFNDDKTKVYIKIREVLKVLQTKPTLPRIQNKKELVQALRKCAEETLGFLVRYRKGWLAKRRFLMSRSHTRRSSIKVSSFCIDLVKAAEQNVWISSVRYPEEAREFFKKHKRSWVKYQQNPEARLKKAKERDKMAQRVLCVTTASRSSKKSKTEEAEG